ncbi:MAG: ABC transporter ATP-binding protein [Rhodospirillales bacterium]
MTAIRIDGVARAFGPVAAVRGVTLAIGQGEFFTLLGPSGCGKTTLLRMVAGFCDLDGGSIHFGKRRIDRVPPHKRNAGMVFQNYAIFPNLTVGGNVAYGLKARGLGAAKIAGRAAQALKLVHLDGYAERWPHQLSGGQLQKNLGITALYVTHDQEEAMAISDRIAVMNAGQVEQIGQPAEIYQQPATPFVARFMGTTNLLSGIVARREGTRAVVRVGGLEFAIDAGALGETRTGAAVEFSLRPEALAIAPPGSEPPAGWVGLEARVLRVEFLGALTRIELSLAGGLALHAAAVDMPRGLGDGVVVLAYDPARVTVFAGPCA